MPLKLGIQKFPQTYERPYNSRRLKVEKKQCVPTRLRIIEAKKCFRTTNVTLWYKQTLSLSDINTLFSSFLILNISRCKRLFMLRNRIRASIHGRSVCSVVTRHLLPLVHIITSARCLACSAICFAVGWENCNCDVMMWLFQPSRDLGYHQSQEQPAR